MGYKVLKYFTDLQDKDHPYEAGDVFPRKGLEVTPERLAELAGSDNKRGEPLIKEEKPKKAAAKKKADADE